MVADSDSRIAWHRAQVRKHRATLKRMEAAEFRFGRIAAAKDAGDKQQIVADLTQKISQSEQIIAQHERQTRRPLATDLRSLSSVSWSDWNAHGSGPR
jgi:hypothetical protein